MIITVTNQKGGVAKSTTVAALLAALTQRGYKALALDLDPQCNLSLITKANIKGGTMLSLFGEEQKAADVIQHTNFGDVIASHAGLAGADIWLKDIGKEYKLKEAIEPLQIKYDYIIIDTPPALGILTVNAMVAADYVVIPSQADILSMQGITSLTESIKGIKKYCNPNLKIAGILLTRYNARNILTANITEMLREQAQSMGTILFKNTIREGIAVKESQINQVPLFEHAPKANPTIDYENFVDELLDIVGKGE